jgi:apolipoprotein N-acyltransferase
MNALSQKLPGAVWSMGLGIMQGLSLSVMFNDQFSSALQVASLGLFLQVNTKTSKPFWNAWIFSTSWLISCVWWLYIALHIHGHLNAIFSMVAIILLCAGLGLYYASALTVFFRFQKHCNVMQQGLLLASLWTLAELARAQWLTGFPWAAIGYAHINSPLSYAAPWVGVYGIGFMAALLVGMLPKLALNKKVVLTWVVMLIGLSVPAIRNQDVDPPNLTVALLQGNIPQDIKFSMGRAEALNWYQLHTLQSEAEFTALPETAIPYFKNDLPKGYWESIENKFDGEKQVAAIGMLTHTATNGYANSAVGVGFKEEPRTYNKYHLVPFGEFTPTFFKWFTKLLSLGLGDFERGAEQPVPLKWKEHLFAMNICYEDVFGEELAQRFVQGPENRPTVLVNLSNIDWFGDTVVIDQHLNIARMRSLEFNRPSIRATNSGGTAIINADGKITHQLKPFTRGVLKGQLVSKDRPNTLYAYWAGHWGLKPLWLVCLLWVIGTIGLIQKKHPAEGGQNLQT